MLGPVTAGSRRSHAALRAGEFVPVESQFIDDPAYVPGVEVLVRAFELEFGFAVAEFHGDVWKTVFPSGGLFEGTAAFRQPFSESVATHRWSLPRVECLGNSRT